MPRIASKVFEFWKFYWRYHQILHLSLIHFYGLIYQSSYTYQRPIHYINMTNAYCHLTQLGMLLTFYKKQSGKVGSFLVFLNVCIEEYLVQYSTLYKKTYCQFESKPSTILYVFYCRKTRAPTFGPRRLIFQGTKYPYCHGEKNVLQTQLGEFSSFF